MKFIQFICLLLVGSLLFSSCKREQIVPFNVAYTDGKANLKIVHASAFTVNTPVQLKVNDERVSNNITYSTPFPGGGLNTGGSNLPWYLSVNPGAVKIAMSIPNARTNLDSILLHTNTVNLDANKHYTAYIVDTAARAQVVLVTENVTPPVNGTSRYKFINLIPNSGPVDLYFAGNLVAGNIAFKAISPEFTLPFNTVGHWAIRPAGSAPTATAIAVYSGTIAVPTNQTVPNQRIFTVFARGYTGVTTGTRIPAISLLYN